MSIEIFLWKETNKRKTKKKMEKNCGEELRELHLHFRQNAEENKTREVLVQLPTTHGEDIKELYVGVVVNTSMTTDPGRSQNKKHWK